MVVISRMLDFRRFAGGALGFMLLANPVWASPRCRPALPDQVSVVDQGNLRTLDFLFQCALTTEFSPWCYQLLIPNEESLPTFRCTYGEARVHQLLNPDESTWKYAFQAIRLIQTLQSEGIQVCEIYNWWRPEPYNKNVGGAPGRHPFGTAVDVRFCSKPDADRAFEELCKMRDQGQQLNAIGYYGGTKLHLGVGDAKSNTWGRNCALGRARRK